MVSLVDVFDVIVGLVWLSVWHCAATIFDVSVNCEHTCWMSACSCRAQMRQLVWSPRTNPYHFGFNRITIETHNRQTYVREMINWKLNIKCNRHAAKRIRCMISLRLFLSGLLLLTRYRRRTLFTHFIQLGARHSCANSTRSTPIVVTETKRANHSCVWFVDW